MQEVLILEVLGKYQQTASYFVDQSDGDVTMSSRFDDLDLEVMVAGGKGPLSLGNAYVMNVGPVSGVFNNLYQSRKITFNHRRTSR